MNAISEENYNQLLLEQTEVLKDASTAIECLLDNLNQYFADFSKFSKLKKDEENSLIEEFDYHYYKLNQYINQINIEIPALVDVVRESEKQLIEHQKNIEELNQLLEDEKMQTNNISKEIEVQKKLVIELSEENEKQKGLIDDLKQKCEYSEKEYSNNLSYSAAMGSVLAKMLWKTSKSNEAIETYIETGTMNHFLNLSNNTINAFKESYPKELPNPETYEFNFIISLLGICINIIAQRIGREFVLEHEIGKELINSVVTYLGDIPIHNGRLLKRLIVMLLYNLTFSKQGILLIQECDNSIDNIINCFNEHHTTEIQSIAVSLMNLLLVNDPESKGFCLNVRQKLSQNEDDFKKLMEKADSKTKDICTQFINKLRAFNDDK